MTLRTSSSPYLLIVKTGDTFPQIREQHGDFEHWFEAALIGAALPLQVIDPRAGEAMPDASELAGVVLTGSHAMVTDDEPWALALMDWLADAVARQTPVLGVCYGHQLLARALGGEVANHPGGVEVGTVTLKRQTETPDALLGALPERFEAMASHWQSVRRLPTGAVLLAGNDFEPHHAFRYGEHAWGLQFHPEFTPEAMQAYLAATATTLERHDRNVSAISAAVRPTPLAMSLLPAFARHAYERLKTTA